MTERLHFHFSLSCIGEGNGNPSSVLAWRIPGMGEPGGLLSLGSYRVRHDWSDAAAAAAAEVTEFQLKYLKPWKMMLLKCCTQYISKFGKLSSGHKTEKVQISFQSQRKKMPKNVQTTIQLCSFHMLARLCSKFFKLDFSSMRTVNFQMYKLGFQKAEEQRSNCQHLLDHGESKRVPKKHLLLLHWLH